MLIDAYTNVAGALNSSGIVKYFSNAGPGSCRK